MASLEPGARLTSTELARRHDLRHRPSIETPHARRHGGAILVRVAELAEARFLVRRGISRHGRSGGVQFEWEERVSNPTNRPAAAEFFVELDDGGAVFVGTGRPWCTGGVTCFEMDPVPESLDGLLMPLRPPITLDGTAIARALHDGVDPLDLLEVLVPQWLGPLSEGPPMDYSGRRPPPEVERWHRLYTRMETSAGHMWSCWPAYWLPKEDGSAWYVAGEDQNGGTFALREDGTVEIHPWWRPRGERTAARAANDVRELALQLLIHGLTDGANSVGYSVGADAADLELFGGETLPLPAWENFFEGKVEWVGGPGFVGERSEGQLQLRVTSLERMHGLAGLFGHS